jgi:hypothetical protein
MVNGFTYHPAFLTTAEADQLLRNIASLSFRSEIFRVT